MKPILCGAIQCNNRTKDGVCKLKQIALDKNGACILKDEFKSKIFNNEE